MDEFPDLQAQDESGAVSASWVFTVLRRRLGCVDMGWRDEMSWYWVTPNGLPFRVAAPAAEATGIGRELRFSRAYARELIGRIRELLKR